MQDLLQEALASSKKSQCHEKQNRRQRIVCHLRYDSGTVAVQEKTNSGRVPAEVFRDKNVMIFVLSDGSEEQKGGKANVRKY